MIGVLIFAGVLTSAPLAARAMQVFGDRAVGGETLVAIPAKSPDFRHPA